MNYLTDDCISICKQMKVNIFRMVETHYDDVKLVVENEFSDPYQKLMKNMPREDFIRPVNCMLERGMASVQVRWIYFIPQRERGSLEVRMAPRDFRFYANGRFKFSGVPDMTPELRDIMEKTNLNLSFVKKANKQLIKMNRCLNELLKVHGLTAEDIKFSEDEVIVFNMGYNPGSEVELQHCYQSCGDPSTWSQDVRKRFSSFLE